jgi:ABC-type branched-subunit amino acid transport system substrate-binding protein
MKIFQRKSLASILGLLLLAGENSLRAADPGVTDTEILLGSSLALEGPASFLGTQTNHGMEAYIRSLNEKGGVNGRKVRVIAYNDGYEPVPCVTNTQKLINEDKVFSLTCYVGTPTSVKALPVWTNAKVPLLGFFTGAEPLRSPFNRYSLHVRPSYYQEADAIVDAFVNKLNYKKIAVFYQYDAFGEAVKKGTEIALQKYGLTPVAYGSFERNTLNVDEGLQKIVSSNPDAIVMVGTYSPLAKFVKEAKKAGLSKTVFHTVSFVGPEAFAKELGSDASRCVVTQVMPPYENNTLPVVKEYKTALKKYFPGDSPNFVSLEGFVNAKVLGEGLKRAGKDITREGFIDAVESMNSFDLGGIMVTYGPEDHVGLEKIYITQIKDGHFVEVKDWNKL